MAPTAHYDLMNDPVVVNRLDYWSARYSRLFRMNQADGQDLRQELAIAIFSNAHRYDASRSSWSSYLSMLCRTAAGRFIARMMRVRLGEVPFLGDEGTADQPLDCCLRCAASAPMDAMEQFEWHDWLNAALAQVTPEMRRTLALIAEGLTVEVTARVLGVHRNTVVTRLRRLRALFGEAFSENITHIIVLSEEEAAIGEDGTPAHRRGRRHA